MVSRRVPAPIKSIALVVSFLTLGVVAPGNSLRAEECLSAPDSPSPQGVHWYYRLDWATQRKCWYLRAPARSLQRAAAAATATPVPLGRREECLSAPDSPSPQGTHWYYRLDLQTQRKCWYLRAPARSLQRAAAATATPVPLGRRHSAHGPPISVDPADTASPSSGVDMLPINPQTSESIPAGVGKLLQQSVQEDISAPAPIGTPVPQASTLSHTGNEVGGPVVAPKTWPDPMPAGAAVQTQNPVAIPTNIPADSASIDARSGGNYLTDSARNSMATILAVLALVLAALCVVARNGAARRAPTIIDQREPGDQRQHDRRDGQGHLGSVDEEQLLVSALCDRGPVGNDDVSFEIAFEIRKRKDNLARLHQNLDRLLQSPRTA